ncbi:MAG: ATP-binding cassette domain-containing protein [Planctomycetes bacterium]|nr:ATP-binding cassette domain-containing protein [Planctomycetota bacterium]
MIQVDQVAIVQGNFRLDDVTFDVPEGACYVLMGRSGSGKTTLLEAICGLRPLARGRVFVDDQDVTRMKPAERGIGYVPQDGALFPTMTVRENLGFALRIRKEQVASIAARTSELADLLGIVDLLDRGPDDLSGGEIQRVALGRALAYHPGVLCLDEPFSALDDETREEMHGLMGQVRQATGCTVLFVTHNLRDAETLGDRILKVEGGQVIALDERPPDLVRPAS